MANETTGGDGIQLTNNCWPQNSSSWYYTWPSSFYFDAPSRAEFEELKQRVTTLEELTKNPEIRKELVRKYAESLGVDLDEL